MSEARLAERVAGESYGRLLALLAARTRDVAAAEDVLAEAFAAALMAWPRGGAPDNPEAWLFAAAKRKLIDAARRRHTAAQSEAQLIIGVEELEAEMAGAQLPDRRLGLMFACTHPDIDVSVRTPLMLQVVLGFSAERIAGAFLIEPTVTRQRLVRAKQKIRDTGIGFDAPEPREWRSRLSAVLDAIYAAYGAGWSDPLGADPERRGLAEEAVWLARVLLSQVADDPEARASCFISRRAAPPAAMRTDASSRSTSKMRAFGRPGRYQFEAAVQSAHVARAGRGETDWDAIVLLYHALCEVTGSPVARLNAAAAVGRRDGPEVGLAAAEAARESFPALNAYQPYWALKADLCAKLGRHGAARAAYDEAIARERDPAVIRFLNERRAALK